MKTKTILYLHGMGGGPECGIAVGLNKYFENKVFKDGSGEELHIHVEAPLYSFDPELANAQISQLVEKARPDLVVAMSLGTYHALHIKGMPHIYISPALGAADALYKAGKELESNPVSRMMAERNYGSAPIEGRQRIIPEYKILKGYKILDTRLPKIDHTEKMFGFFGSNDSYRPMNVVSTKLWEGLFNNTNYKIVEGADHNFTNYDVMPEVIEKAKEFLEVESET